LWEFESLPTVENLHRLRAEVRRLRKVVRPGREGWERTHWGCRLQSLDFTEAHPSLPLGIPVYSLPGEEGQVRGGEETRVKEVTKKVAERPCRVVKRVSRAVQRQWGPAMKPVVHSGPKLEVGGA
jgi:hypothetical protein